MQPPERKEEGALLPPINGPTTVRAGAAASIPIAPLWRPRSARLAPPAGVRKWDPYESTMKHDFIFTPATEFIADCARGGRGHAIPFQVNEPTGRNTYTDEFCWKPYCKAEPIRAASATGIRRNNPQPSDRFLVWKLPQDEAENVSPWIKPISKEEIEETLRKQFKTIYSRDYLGLQPGAPQDSAPIPPDWKTLVPQPPDTEARRNYRPPTLAPDLINLTKKYGCNRKRHVPVKGAVPSVSSAQIWNYEHTKQVSTYQRDFGKDDLEILTVLNSLDPETVKAYVERAPNPEKAILQNFLNKVRENMTSQRPSSAKTPRENPLDGM
ncbi:testis-expressed protein 26 isoform X2 [Hemicordylus capensis]|uniref:testis-expressed protein 26 isoform X2 n=1 Tax=Hemicordylus capensis TaxID=884348 RepID=UPI0023036961|nr:testis-expressed protein 26 isoform X2 [Hemicordylus capensis]